MRPLQGRLQQFLNSSSPNRQDVNFENQKYYIFNNIEWEPMCNFTLQWENLRISVQQIGGDAVNDPSCLEHLTWSLWSYSCCQDHDNCDHRDDHYHRRGHHHHGGHHI